MRTVHLSAGRDPISSTLCWKAIFSPRSIFVSFLWPWAAITVWVYFWGLLLHPTAPCICFCDRTMYHFVVLICVLYYRFKLSCMILLAQCSTLLCLTKPCLVSELRGIALIFSQFNFILAIDLLCMVLTCCVWSLLCLGVMCLINPKTFNKKGFWIFVKGFFSIEWNDHVFFFLSVCLCSG